MYKLLLIVQQLVPWSMAICLVMWMHEHVRETGAFRLCYIDKNQHFFHWYSFLKVFCSLAKASWFLGYNVAETVSYNVACWKKEKMDPIFWRIQLMEQDGADGRWPPNPIFVDPTFPWSKLKRTMIKLEQTKVSSTWVKKS